jgi:hypothetical protein
VPHSNVVLFDVRGDRLELTSFAPFSQGKPPPRRSWDGPPLHKSAEGEATRHDSLDQPVICAGSVVGQAYTDEQVLEAGVGAEVIDP